MRLHPEWPPENIHGSTPDCINASLLCILQPRRQYRHRFKRWTRSNRGQISISSGNQIKQILEGTLVIDITSINPEKSQSRLNETVNLLLENIPPPNGANMSDWKAPAQL